MITYAAAKLLSILTFAKNAAEKGAYFECASALHEFDYYAVGKEDACYEPINRDFFDLVLAA